MKKPCDDRSGTPESARTRAPGLDQSIARLMGLGERSVQKSYYPQLRRKIEELEKSEARYRLLAENISDVIWMLDSAGIIVYISPSIERNGGYTPGELTGKPFAEILTPEHARQFTGLIKKEIGRCDGTQSNHLAGDLEVEQINRDGSTTWIELRISCLAGSTRGEKQILGISRDISDQKRAAREKQEIQDQLLQAQKMESIGTLAGGIAHDFNNLLTIINGYADLIRTTVDKEDPLIKKINAISHAGKRAQALTRKLLAFSRKQDFTPEKLNINVTLLALDQMLSRLIGEDIRMETRIQKDIRPILADQTQIEQILTNLVINARDALSGSNMPDTDKRITLETGQTRISAREAGKLGLYQPGDYVYFTVADNGCGMEQAVLKRIFEPFFTTKPKERGTGLGLAVIYGIITQNMGSIRVRSAPGRGSRFKVYWPVAEQAKVIEERQEEAVPDLTGDERILVVEDDPEVRTYTVKALESLGYEIFEAENGARALEWIRERTELGDPLPHLTVTDMVMPEMGGREFAQKAKALWPYMEVLFVSGHGKDYILARGLLDAGDHFLHKPYSRQELAGEIRSLLG